MNENQKKIASRVQDLGALIALVILVIGISIVSPEFRTGSNFCHCFVSRPLTD